MIDSEAVKGALQMRNRWKYKVFGLFVLLTAIGIGIGLYGLSPQWHFRSAVPHVLALPQPVPVDEDASDPMPVSIPDTSISPSPTTNDDTNAFNVVLIGTDSWGDESSRADSIMVVRVMPDSRKVNIVSVPRDTRVYVQGVGYTKINHAHSVGEAKGGNQQGTKTLVQAVSDFLNIPVHHYIKTNLAGVSNFIDKIGGIDLYIEQNVTITPEIVIPQGDQHLDGQHALFLARERYSVSGGDFGRQIEQFRIVRAVARQLLKPEHLPDLAGLIKSGRRDIMDTSFTDSDLISLAWLFKGMDTDDFTYEQIPGKDSYGHDPLVGSDVYYWSADSAEVLSMRGRLFQMLE
jgi:LCP family protein required for cell wall assembly